MPEDEIQNPAESLQAPRDPRIDKVNYQKSIANIYEPVDLFDRAKQEDIKIYDRSDFGTPIERASFGLGSIQTQSGELAVEFSGIIQLDRSRKDMSKLVSRFKQYFKAPYPGATDGKIEFEASPFSNLFILNDTEYRTKGLVVIYDDGRILIMNQGSFSNDTANYNLEAPVADTIDGPKLISGGVKFFMRALDYANSTTEEYHRTDLKREYQIGETVIPSSINTLKSMGQKIVRQVQTPTPSSEKQKSLDSIEGLSGVDIIQPDISLDDIGGLGGVKSELRDIAISFEKADIMEKWGASRPQGVLLYGEAGTGKTMLARALANEIKATVWEIQGSDIYAKWLGESEANIKALVSRARTTRERTIILFDEIDAIIGITEELGPGGAGQSRNAVAGIFKQELNTLAAENPNVLVVGTTNHLDRIDPALVRSGRFDHKVYVPMPDQEARSEIVSSIVSKAMFQHENDDFKIFTDDLNVGDIAYQTDGMSGADLSEIFRRLMLQKAMQEARNGEASPITHEDVLSTIRRFKTEG
jgi:ATP-dependent 26S proteasome regulatory subunit